MFALTATAMLLPSCSSDDIVPQGGEATVILTAKLPDGLQTRAFADGKTAKHLQMVVMQAEGDRPYGDNLSVFDSGDVYTAEFQNGKLYTEVSVKLVSGKRYAVICWADAGEEKSPYDFNTTTHTVTANYANRTTSDETLDAFYACTAFTVKMDIRGGVFEGAGQLLKVLGTGDNVNKITVEISGGIFVGNQPDAKYLKSGYKFNQIDYNGKVAFEVVHA